MQLTAFTEVRMNNLLGSKPSNWYYFRPWNEQNCNQLCKPSESHASKKTTVQNNISQNILAFYHIRSGLIQKFFNPKQFPHLFCRIFENTME